MTNTIVHSLYPLSYLKLTIKAVDTSITPFIIKETEAMRVISKVTTNQIIFGILYLGIKIKTEYSGRWVCSEKWDEESENLKKSSYYLFMSLWSTSLTRWWIHEHRVRSVWFKTVFQMPSTIPSTEYVLNVLSDRLNKAKCPCIDNTLGSRIAVLK